MEDIKIKIQSKGKTIDSMDSVELINFLDDRYSDMSSSQIRQDAEKDWDEADAQFTALSVRDAYGNLQVNLPMEQNLIDTYEGRASGKIVFDIQPNGKQANVDELQPAQYATEFYLEGGDNKGNGFYDEAPVIRRHKARYGTAFAFVGLENNRQLMYKVKEGAEIKDVADLENQSNYDPYILDAWELFPKHLHVRSVYIDEKALGQKDIQKAEDIIIEKVMSLDKINFIRGSNNGYKNISELKESALSESQKKNQDEFARNQVVIRFYYNILTKDYVVYAPQDKLEIHRSKMLYNHGMIPVEVVQHYSNDNSMYGIGIPKKIRYLKGYKSEIMQAILDNASQTSSLNFVLGNDGTVEDFNLGGNGVNVWRTSVGAENIKQIQPQINSGLIALLNVLDDLVVQDTGENVRATIDMQTDKVGIVEMMEENKAIRHKSVDENWNLFLDAALTIMLSNIAQFVPALMSKTTTTKQGDQEITKIEYPYIRIKDAVVKKDKGGKMIVEKEDNYGKLGYFELKPGAIPQGLGIKIVTPSSTNTLPIVKKDNISKWIENKMTLAQLAALDTSGEMMNQLRATINIGEINDWMNDVYGFEDKLKSQTGKDKIKKANMEKIEKLRQLLSVEPMQPLQPTEQNGQTTGTPMNSQTKQAPVTPQGGEVQAGAVAGANEATMM